MQIRGKDTLAPGLSPCASEPQLPSMRTCLSVAPFYLGLHVPFRIEAVIKILTDLVSDRPFAGFSLPTSLSAWQCILICFATASFASRLLVTTCTRLSFTTSIDFGTPHTDE